MNPPDSLLPHNPKSFRIVPFDDSATGSIPKVSNACSLSSINNEEIVDGNKEALKSPTEQRLHLPLPENYRKLSLESNFSKEESKEWETLQSPQNQTQYFIKEHFVERGLIKDQNSEQNSIQEAKQDRVKTEPNPENLPKILDTQNSASSIFPKIVLNTMENFESKLSSEEAVFTFDSPMNFRKKSFSRIEMLRRSFLRSQIMDNGQDGDASPFSPQSGNWSNVENEELKKSAISFEASSQKNEVNEENVIPTLQ